MRACFRRGGKIKHRKGQVVVTKDVGFSSFDEGLYILRRSGVTPNGC